MLSNLRHPVKHKNWTQPTNSSFVFPFFSVILQHNYLITFSLLFSEQNKSYCHVQTGNNKSSYYTAAVKNPERKPLKFHPLDGLRSFNLHKKMNQTNTYKFSTQDMQVQSHTSHIINSKSKINLPVSLLDISVLSNITK